MTAARKRTPVPPAPFPGSSVIDRFHDWEDAMAEESCTRECGAARNDICVCRCLGLHHNAAHDYWATLPRKIVTQLPGGSAITSINTHVPDKPLSEHIKWLESIGQAPGCNCDWNWYMRRNFHGWGRKNTNPACPAHSGSFLR
jgi:hypothetical protein